MVNNVKKSDIKDYLEEINDKLRVANELKVLELCLKYSQHDKVIHRNYKMMKDGVYES